MQKIIKIGTSSGITIPAKDLKHEGLEPGDTVEFTARVVRKGDSADAQVVATAKKILKEYKQDFKNLSQR